MARAKITKKKALKKQNVQAGSLQKHSGSTFDGKKSGDSGEIPSNIPSTVAQKSVDQTTRTVISSNVLPETTPASHRDRVVHRKKLTNVFYKSSSDVTPAVAKVIQSGNLFLTSTPKESEAVHYGFQPNIHNGGSASMPETVRTKVKRSAATELEEIAKSSPEDGIDSPDSLIKQKQRTINFYYYPVEDTRKWVKEELAKPPPRKKVVTKKRRAPTTDEMSQVLLWGSPSRRKRTLRDLTDLEVAFTIFKDTVEEFSDCVSDRGMKMIIAKYEEYVERGIVKKLQEIEDAKKMQEQIKKLEQENKALSLDLGSLIDRKMRLQHKLAKRRKLGQE